MSEIKIHCIFVKTKTFKMTKIRNNQNSSDFKLSNMAFIIGGAIIVGIILLTILTA